MSIWIWTLSFGRKQNKDQWFEAFLCTWHHDSDTTKTSCVFLLLLLLLLPLLFIMPLPLLLPLSPFTSPTTAFEYVYHFFKFSLFYHFLIHLCLFLCPPKPRKETKSDLVNWRSLLNIRKSVLFFVSYSYCFAYVICTLICIWQMKIGGSTTTIVNFMSPVLVCGKNTYFVQRILRCLAHVVGIHNLCQVTIVSKVQVMLNCLQHFRVILNEFDSTNFIIRNYGGKWEYDVCVGISS